MGASKRESYFVEDTHELSDRGGGVERESWWKMFNPFVVLQKKFHAGGVKSTIITLISGTLGAGCLTMPDAFRASGIGWS